MISSWPSPPSLKSSTEYLPSASDNFCSLDYKTMLRIALFLAQKQVLQQHFSGALLNGPCSFGVMREP